MVNKAVRVKTLKFYNKVIMGLKPDGELGRTNVADKWMNCRCTCDVKKKKKKVY